MTTPETTPETTAKVTPRKKPSTMGSFLRTAAEGQSQMVPAQDSAPKVKKEPSKVRMNIYLTREDADLVRDAVYAMPRHYTLGSMMTEFLPSMLEALAKEHNGGKPFPVRPEEAHNLTSGPPPRLKTTLAKREDRP